MSKLTKILLSILLTVVFCGGVKAQVSFSTIYSKLKIAKNNDGTSAITCENPTMQVSFQLKRNVTAMEQNNLLTIDNQVIQITPLEFSGFKNGNTALTTDDEKRLLGIYSKYELDYFKNELKTEIINANNQWVVTKGKGWFIWYFRVNKTPVQADKKVQIQLFASTVIGGKILTINAPVFSDDDFTKAGLIVNDMMETLKF